MERVFPLLNNVFGAQQTMSLNDLVEGADMLRFNRGQRMTGPATKAADEAAYAEAVVAEAEIEADAVAAALQTELGAGAEEASPNYIDCAGSGVN